MSLHRFVSRCGNDKAKKGVMRQPLFLLYFSPLCSSLLTYTFIYVRLKCTNIAVRRTQSLAGKPSLNHDLCQGKKRTKESRPIILSLCLTSYSPLGSRCALARG